ncbi:MAG: FAD:protein FMN transferase [Myxococcota bacterium]
MTSAESKEGFKPSLRWYLVLGTLVAGLAWIVLSEGPSDVRGFDGETMGTPYTVRIDPPISRREMIESQRALEELMRRLDQELWSTWTPFSELSRFNAHASTDPHPVSQDTAALVRRALAIAEASGGRFDPTVAPLVRAFGFGAEAAASPPDTDALASLRRRVGHGNVRVLENPPRLRKTHPEVELDLSGIAKGRVVDDAIALLRRRHPDRAIMVEIGGEVCGHGRKTNGQPWRIGIQDPRTPVPTVLQSVPLENRCMATSGDYRQFREHHGARYGHTLDPLTGRPRETDLASVTVFADRCEDADAWATALLVAGRTLAAELSPHPALLLRPVGEDLARETIAGADGVDLVADLLASGLP